MEFNGKPMTTFGTINADWSGDLNALADQLAIHKEDTANPHQVTPQKIGAIPEGEMLDIADYVIDRGVDGDWFVERWASGKAVCWGVISIGTVSVETGWGTLFESQEYTKDFPNGLFYGAPQVAMLSLRGSASALDVNRYGTLTAENIGLFTFSRPTARTVENVSVSALVIGRWK